MKSFRGPGACLLLFLLTPFFNLQAAQGAEVLRVRADSWMPFNGDPSAGKPGYAVDLLREIFEPAGIKVEYQIMPWTDALKSVEAGEVDAVIGANKKEAAKLVTGTEPIGDPKFALFVRSKSEWRYASLRSLAEVKLGAIEGYSYWDSLDGYLQKTHPPAVKFYRGETPLVEALTDLSSGKIDVLVESVVVFYWTAKSLGRKGADFRIAYLQEAEPIYVAFAPNPKGRDQAGFFDRGIRELKKTGRFDAILGQYGLGK
ncbi:MAG TPA: transporter substrate-binding domain-containing protein [Opitutaceae bacterium]|nr:transporter substrate-binding domain-containing protein [Opitutaceae bacterium]